MDTSANTTTATVKSPLISHLTHRILETNADGVRDHNDDHDDDSNDGDAALLRHLGHEPALIRSHSLL
jgi:hypothetical protein